MYIFLLPWYEIFVPNFLGNNKNYYFVSLSDDKDLQSFNFVNDELSREIVREEGL